MSETRRWWLRKRFLLPVLALASLGISVAVAFVGSDSPVVVVYNHTGQALPPLVVIACGQSRTFAAIANDASVQLPIAPRGVPGPIALEIATEPPWRWEGAYVAPRGGHRVTLYLWPGGQVEAHAQISFWQRLFSDVLNVSE